MLDISFLNSTSYFKSRSGMEFLDWQTNSFFQDLSLSIKETYDSVSDTLRLSKADRNDIAGIIKKHTNITVEIHAEEDGNLAVDAGFIGPNSVLNNPGLDGWFGKEYTKVGEAFKDLKKNVLKGYCDLRTGKVEGDFKNFNFNVYININLPANEMNKTYIKESGVHIYEAIAAGILHECGHVFFGLHYLSSTVIDNAMMSQCIKMLIKEPDKNRRIIIAKDIKKDLDIDLGDSVSNNSISKEEVTVAFEKGLMNRDYRRTLSLGVTEMTAEVLADAYAVRMGASHALVGLLGSFYSQSPFWFNVKAILISIILMLFPPTIGFSVLMWIFIFVKITLEHVNTYVPGTYDTPYRRLKTILRDNIAYLQTNPNGFSKEQIRKMITDAKLLEKMVEEQKSTFEGKLQQRFIGYLINGSDFKKSDFEHYTADIANPTLTLYTNILTDKD